MRVKQYAKLVLFNMHEDFIQKLILFIFYSTGSSWDQGRVKVCTQRINYNAGTGNF